MDNNFNNQPNQDPSNDNTSAKQAPIVQPTATTPESATVPGTISTSAVPQKSKGLLHILGVLLLLILLAAVAYAAYTYGKGQSKPAPAPTNNMSAMTSVNITVPNGATLLEQCVPGLGAQYVMPKNIPDGPIYNVYNGKVVGLEYMEDLSNLTTPSAMTTLDLMGTKYDHVNISRMPGHAGLEANHYQIDFMFISQSQANMIKCASSSSSTSNGNMSM